MGRLTDLMKESVKIHITSERLKRAMLNINYRQTLSVIEMMREMYSHLDPIGLKTEDMPIELFTSYEKWVGSLARRIGYAH